MTTLNSRLQLALVNSKKSKNALQRGFTLIELMVVVAIVGVLTAVGLPQLTAAQNRAKASAATQEVVNQAKSCSIALLGGESFTTSSPVSGTCGAGEVLKASDGGKDVKVTIDAAFIPGEPVITDTPTT